MYDADFFSGLVPELASLARQHRSACEAKGLHLVFVEGRRTFDQQMAKFDQGRARTLAGWKVVDASKVVTLALPMQSPHCRGAAYDCAPTDQHERIDWLRLDLFKAVADLAPAGLTWGGTFPIHDLDHFELSTWRSIPYDLT
jgi:hypothetical protein